MRTSNDPKETFLKIRISEHLLSRFKKYAEYKGETVSEIVRSLMEREVQDGSRKENGQNKP